MFEFNTLPQIPSFTNYRLKSKSLNLAQCSIFVAKAFLVQIRFCITRAPIRVLLDMWRAQRLKIDKNLGLKIFDEINKCVDMDAESEIKPLKRKFNLTCHSILAKRMK